jgi:hypothetical protein
MSNPLRQDVLLALSALSEAFPEWRLGQMVANLAVTARGATVESIWDVEDDELLAAINQHLDRRKARSLVEK